MGRLHGAREAVCGLLALHFLDSGRAALVADPHFPAFEVLLFPDRHHLFQAVHKVQGGFESGPAMCRADRDDEARLPDVHTADAMRDRDAVDLPLG